MRKHLDNRPSLSVGDIVESVSGRGKNKLFLVVKVFDHEYVYISDGETRKMNNAKLKKNLHLRHLGSIPEIDFLENRDGTADAAIRKLLKGV